MRARDHLARKRARERERLERERWRAEHVHSRARMRRILAPLLFLGALGSGALLSQSMIELAILRATPLEQIAVQGARALSPEAIASRAGVESGQSLASIDPAQVRHAILQEPWVESVRVLRLPSGVLAIGVVEREAIGRWRADDENELELIDRRGVRFAGQPDSRRLLPLVQGPADAPPQLSDEARALLTDIGRHAPLAARADTILVLLPTPGPASQPAGSAGADGYVIQIGESGPRVLLGRRRLARRVARLAALLESDEPAISAARWIDLRYADHAVLRTEPVSG